MTIKPARLNLDFSQNATWEFSIRFCAGARDVTADPQTGIFTSEEPHYLTANKVVVFASKGGGPPPVGLYFNQPYHVIASGLTANTFSVSLAQGGPPVALTTSDDGNLVVAAVMDVTDDILDADIVAPLTGQQVGTFVPTKTDAVNGLVKFRLPPTESVSIEPGKYHYDVSITTAAGDRYYYVQGDINAGITYSRNA